MPILSRDEILAVNDIKTELVSVPEWGGEVYVKGMTGAERDAFEAGIVEMHGKSQSVNMTNVRAKLVSACVCDENGKRLFNDKDVLQLSKKSAAALQRVFEVGQRLSGIGEEAVQELVDGLKNDQSGDSILD